MGHRRFKSEIIFDVSEKAEDANVSRVRAGVLGGGLCVLVMNALPTP
jgi:hypothetical protein